MSHHILCIRLDGIGDALTCVPALEGLRQANPGAQFHAVCSPRNSGVYSPSRVRTLVAGAHDFEEQLAKVSYDAAIVFTEEVEGYALARESKAPRRIGFWHRFEKPLKSLWQCSQLTDRVYRPAAWVRRPEHEVESMYRLALTLGAAPPPPDDASLLRPWLRTDGAPKGVASKSLGFQITPKLASGGWGPLALARTIAATLAAPDFRQCTLLCAPSDERLARATMEHLERALPAGTRANIAATSDVARWFGGIASVTALITADTGAAHAAGMLGTPVVDLFDEDRFDQLVRRWRPWAAPSRCIQKSAWRAGVEEELGYQIGNAVTELVG